MKSLCITAGLALLGISIEALPAHAEPAASSHHAANNTLVYLEASLLIQSLNADLLSHDSATLTLERWCADHRLAPSPKVVADRVPGATKEPTDDQRRELGVSSSDTVRYRKVKLVCGDVVLSEADNWYVPDRLTPEIIKLLETTDTSFGKAVQPLHFRRHTIYAQPLATLLPDKWWEMSAADLAAQSGKSCLPPYVLQHRAVLTLPDSTPFSEVVETYTANILGSARSGLTDCREQRAPVGDVPLGKIPLQARPHLPAVDHARPLSPALVSSH